MARESSTTSASIVSSLSCRAVLSVCRQDRSFWNDDVWNEVVRRAAGRTAARPRDGKRRWTVI